MFNHIYGIYAKYTVSTLLYIQQADQNAKLRKNENKMMREWNASLFNVFVDRWSGSDGCYSIDL